jgi:hypothetical protein
MMIPMDDRGHVNPISDEQLQQRLTVDLLVITKYIMMRMCRDRLGAMEMTVRLLHAIGWFIMSI